jgi:hypothetical protein
MNCTGTSGLDFSRKYNKLIAQVIWVETKFMNVHHVEVLGTILRVLRLEDSVWIT